MVFFILFLLAHIKSIDFNAMLAHCMQFALCYRLDMNLSLKSVAQLGKHHDLN